MDKGYQTTLLPRLPEGTARPQLASSSRAGGDVRCDAFLFDRGGRWLPHIDVLWHMLKAVDFPNNPPNPAYQPEMAKCIACFNSIRPDQPEVHRIAAEMREIADSYGAKGQGERVLIGEIYLPVDRLMHYYGVERPGVHLPSISSSSTRRGRPHSLGTAIH